MGFGDSTVGNISTNTAYSVQTADKMDEVGTVTEFTTYGGTEEVTEEVYAEAGSFVNLAVNSQVGNTTAAGVTSHTLVESNTDYARATKVSRMALSS
jgi:hypothetical protein